MLGEARWNEPYRKYETQKSDNMKGKVLILAIVVMSLLLIVFFYFTRQNVECGASDGVCPEGCSYSEDADCEKTITTTVMTATTTSLAKSDCNQECKSTGYESGRCLSGESAGCDAYFVSIGEMEGCKKCCCKMLPTTNESTFA